MRYGTNGISILAVAAILTISTAANAQDGANAEETAIDSASGEIIVTAQRREERLQDVPISISAVGSEELAKRNVSDLSGLAGAVPGLSITILRALMRAIWSQSAAFLDNRCRSVLAR
jgi:outer membrane receptor for ferrienterochelin and colicin